MKESAKTITLRCIAVALCIFVLAIIANVWGVEKVIQSSVATLIGFICGYQAGKAK